MTTYEYEKTAALARIAEELAKVNWLQGSMAKMTGNEVFERTRKFVNKRQRFLIKLKKKLDDGEEKINLDELA